MFVYYFKQGIYIRSIIFPCFNTRVPTPKRATLSTFCDIASVLLFIFIIAYLFLYIIVLFLLLCCQFIRCNEVWVQFICLRWLIQDIFFVTLLIGIWMPYFIGNDLNCYWGVLLLRIWIIYYGGYSRILILGFQHQMRNPFYIFDIVSKLLFRFIINSNFLYIVVLLLFGCCHSRQHDKFQVQFISVQFGFICIWQVDSRICRT